MRLAFRRQDYAGEMAALLASSREDFVKQVRRDNQFARGKSKYRGVTRRSAAGRWEARISGVFGKKYTYLGTFDTAEEAAMAYDRAAIAHKGRDALTNFELSRYEPEMGAIMQMRMNQLQGSLQAASVKPGGAGTGAPPAGPPGEKEVRLDASQELAPVDKGAHVHSTKARPSKVLAPRDQNTGGAQGQGLGGAMPPVSSSQSPPSEPAPAKTLLPNGCVLRPRGRTRKTAAILKKKPGAGSRKRKVGLDALCAAAADSELLELAGRSPGRAEEPRKRARSGAGGGAGAPVGAPGDAPAPAAQPGPAPRAASPTRRVGWIGAAAVPAGAGREALGDPAPLSQPDNTRVSLDGAEIRLFRRSGAEARPSPVRAGRPAAGEAPAYDELRMSQISELRMSQISGYEGVRLEMDIDSLLASQATAGEAPARPVLRPMLTPTPATSAGPSSQREEEAIGSELMRSQGNGAGGEEGASRFRAQAPRVFEVPGFISPLVGAGDEHAMSLHGAETFASLPSMREA